MTKDRIFSGIQPSGTLTVGNYLGALRNFVKLQDEYDCLYCIVDLHALTSDIKAEDLYRNSFNVLALYLACGLDFEKSIIYIQSHVPEHAELGWILNTITPLGHLSRMTQYKDKAKKHADNLYAGLLNYPVLMAADIILYDAKYVPVGDDQRQHIEFTRDLVEKFNSRYSETFVMPKMLSTKTGTRIMSLQDPKSKMSKSDPDENGFISMLDEPKKIEKKIKRAVTDSLSNFSYNEEQAGLKNLIDIYAAFTDEEVQKIVDKYKDFGYGKFKSDLAEIVIESLKPIQEEYNRYLQDKAELAKIYRKGAQRARNIASKKLEEVYEKIGILPR